MNPTAKTQNMIRTQCFLFEGLGNRINGLVSALLTNREVDVRWSVNQHCPVRFEQLFFPVEGTHVQNVDDESFPYIQDANRICCRFLVNVANLEEGSFRTNAKKHYRSILNQLKHRPDFDLPERTVGIHYRAYFEAESGEQFDGFVSQLKSWLDQKGPTCVFIASDSRQAKLRIQDAVERFGYQTAIIECPLLVTGDFDRSLENLIGMSKEMILFGQCSRGILSNSAQSSVCDSARGFDVPIERMFDSDFDERDRQLESWVNDPSCPPA